MYVKNHNTAKYSCLFFFFYLSFLTVKNCAETLKIRLLILLLSIAPNFLGITKLETIHDDWSKSFSPNCIHRYDNKYIKMIHIILKPILIFYFAKNLYLSQKGVCLTGSYYYAIGYFIHHWKAVEVNKISSDVLNCILLN